MTGVGDGNPHTIEVWHHGIHFSYWVEVDEYYGEPGRAYACDLHVEITDERVAEDVYGTTDLDELRAIIQDELDHVIRYIPHHERARHNRDCDA